MNNAINEFLIDLKMTGRTQGTITKHKEELQRFSKWIEENHLAWDTLTRQQLQKYIRSRSHLGASAIRNMICNLRVFYRWATEEEYIETSPATSLKTPKTPKPLPRALTIDQVRELISYLAQQDGLRARRDEVLMLTGLYCGLRARELAELRWKNIDLDANIINIHISKMGHGRSVSIHPGLRPYLLNWQTIQQLAGNAPVFALHETPINANRVGKVARSIAHATGLPLTAHVLRHTFATWSLRHSGDLYAVSKALGHKQVRQTEIYVSADIEYMREAINTLPSIGEW